MVRGGWKYIFGGCGWVDIFYGFVMVGGMGLGLFWVGGVSGDGWRWMGVSGGDHSF